MGQVSPILGDVCGSGAGAGQDVWWRCIQEPWQQVPGAGELLAQAGRNVQGAGVTHCPAWIPTLPFPKGAGLLSQIHSTVWDRTLRT